MKTQGIHHISSMVGDAQKDVDFYASLLAYRLVKKTLNHEDKNMYHLYYGNREANTGIVTTFPMNHSRKGQVGNGQLGIASFGIRSESFDFWKDRLTSFGIEFEESTRFNKKRISFEDPDGLQLEFIETKKGPKNTWTFNGVGEEHAIIGIESSVLYSKKPEETLQLLTDILGYSVIDENNKNYLLKIHDEFGGLLELAKNYPIRGIPGVGTVHHLSLAVNNDDIDEWKEKLINHGYRPTKVINRGCFQSLYFTDNGGILIELATKGPGLVVDEDLEQLGEKFIIPDHLKKEEIGNLESIVVRELDPNEWKHENQ